MVSLQNVAALIAAVTILQIGQGLLGVQIPLAFVADGHSRAALGFVAAELLAKNPNPTVDQIKDAYTNKPPSPHLCRCGTYAAIIGAVQLAAKAMQI